MTASELESVRFTVRDAARRSGLPMTFGGLVSQGRLVLSEFFGNTTSSLRGVAVTRGSGLGGRVLELNKPCYVEDYARAAGITHEYDGPVGQEGIQSLVAVPVRVAGETRAVIYAGIRDRGSIGSHVIDAVVAAAQQGARDLARLLNGQPSPLPSPPRGGDSSVIERVRMAHAELRSIAQTVEDPHLKGRLMQLAADLTGRPSTTSQLAPREIDVLALIAMGMTNGDAARQLGLGTETVKSYLRTAMSKLGATTRLEAVSRARLLGQIP